MDVVGHLTPVLLLHLQQPPCQAPQLYRRLLLLADVVEHENDADDVSLRISDRRPAVIDGPPRAIFGYQHSMICQADNRTLSPHLRDRGIRRRPGLLIHDVEDVRERLAGRPSLPTAA